MAQHRERKLATCSNRYVTKLESICVNYVYSNRKLIGRTYGLTVGRDDRPFDMSRDTLYLALVDASPEKAKIAADAWEAEADRIEAEAAA